MSTRPLAVIDTNVALDLLVFGDRSCRALLCALQERRLGWIATAGMRRELAAVLARGFGGRWPVDAGAALSAWDGWVTMVEAPAGGDRLRCTDPDDQMFIDLAMSRRGCWLLSRDRALLRLSRPARAWAVVARAPGEWLREALAGGQSA